MKKYARLQMRIGYVTRGEGTRGKKTKSGNTDTHLESETVGKAVNNHNKSVMYVLRC